ncbi:MAG: hypothetical protein MZV63_35775 [Marinilabiliales bacterium]|nr:hypothetical protein [Marinilabiliales bacterium]
MRTSTAHRLPEVPASSVVPSLVSNFALVGATQMNGTYNPAGYFNGDMLEIAVFSGQLNDAERVVLHNNLGAKYLLPIADDHYAWEVTHSHDVSGIAAFNGTTFTNAWSTGMLSVTSPTGLTEGEYLFFGHNKANAKTWTTNEVPAPGTFRLAREWRFDETGDVGTVTISIPAASLPAFPAGYPTAGNTYRCRRRLLIRRHHAPDRPYSRKLQRQISISLMDSILRLSHSGQR